MQFDIVGSGLILSVHFPVYDILNDTSAGKMLIAHFAKIMLQII